jgi:hypothetical protein
MEVGVIFLAVYLLVAIGVVAAWERRGDKKAPQYVCNDCMCSGTLVALASPRAHADGCAIHGEKTVAMRALK